VRIFLLGMERFMYRYLKRFGMCHPSHTHPFNGPLSGTTRVSRYQKGKTNLDFTEARDSEWQWHQAICKSAPRSRQITMPAPHCLVTARVCAIHQHTQNEHWRRLKRVLQSYYYTSKDVLTHCDRDYEKVRVTGVR